MDILLLKISRYNYKNILISNVQMLTIIAAFKFEVCGFLKNMDVRIRIRTGGITIFYGNLTIIPALVILTGIGKKNALNAARLLENFINGQPPGIDNNEIKKLLSFMKPEQMIRDNVVILTGICGAISGKLEVGEVVCYRKIKNPGQGAEFRDIDPLTTNNDLITENNSFPYVNILKDLQLRKVTCCNVGRVICSIEEKADILSASGAEVIDMESYWLAGRLCMLDIPLIFIKVISDSIYNHLPDCFQRLSSNRSPAGSFLSFTGSALLSLFKKEQRNLLIGAVRNLKIARKKLTCVQNKVISNLIRYSKNS
jgi:nucleoside phosphorylase